MTMKHAAILGMAVLCGGCASTRHGAAPTPSHFSFTIINDIEGAALENTKEFRQLLDDVNRTGGPGAFIINCGDHIPGIEAEDSEFQKAFGPKFPWYPGIGNNDQKEPEKVMRFIRSRFRDLPYIVNPGPLNCETTTYSWDYGDAHFVMLNLYFDGETDNGTRRPGTAGKMIPQLYYWLADDLASTDKRYIFVIAHEPAFPQPDADYGLGEDDEPNMVRHGNDSLNEYPVQRDAFWALLKQYGVTAVFNGHIHRYSRYLHEGVWQITVSESRGLDKFDQYLRVKVGPNGVTFDSHRPREGVFQKTDTWTVTRNVDSPVIEEMAKTAHVGVEYVYQLQLTYRDPRTEWSIVKGPAGLTIDQCGFLRGWIPKADEAGKYFPISVRATDPKGGAETEWPVGVEPLPADTVAMFPFNTGPEGWTLETWMKARYGPASVSWERLGGHPGGTLFSVGHGNTNDNRCSREGTHLTRTISTQGFKDIRVEFDVIADLACSPCGGSEGLEGGIDGSTDDELIVSYSTTGSKGPWTTARVFKPDELPAQWTRKVVDLSAAEKVANNPEFTVRLTWQFNTFADSGRIDNVAIKGTR